MKLSLYCFVYFYVSIVSCYNIEDDIKCTREFCEDYVERFPCPVPHELCANKSRSLTVPSPTTCNCCEHCFVFQELGEDCIMGRPGQPLPNIMCGPGTECVNGKCQKKTKPDVDFYPGYECRNGTCHCAVIVNEEPFEIFGQFPDRLNKTWEQQCGCSIFYYRARETMRELGLIAEELISVPRCLPNGQFDPLQCFGDTCGCVDPSTGAWDTSVKKVPIPALAPNFPKCFDPSRHTEGEYYTTCETERNEIMNELLWSETGDFQLIFTHRVECTPDGKYVT